MSESLVTAPHVGPLGSPILRIADSENFVRRRQRCNGTPGRAVRQVLVRITSCCVARVIAT